MPSAIASLRALILDALSSQPYIAHTPPGFTEPTAYAAKPTAVSSVLRLDDDELPSLFDKDGRLIRDPASHRSATSIKLSAALVAASRVAMAGAHIIVRPDQSEAVPTGHTGIVALRRDVSAFRTIEAAEFSTPADDAEVAVSAHPASAAAIDWSTSIPTAYRVELPRLERRDVGEELIVSEVMASIILGLSRAADSVLLSAIAAQMPPAWSPPDNTVGEFTLAAAAARGLKFSELRALIGTAGYAATVGADGALRAAGIPGELTPDALQTIVGAFSRAAVAVHPEVMIHMDRSGKQGDLTVTAWAQFVPCVPDATAFWFAA